MSTKLNAEQLAQKVELLSSDLYGNVAEWVCEDLDEIASAIREVAQPIADQRDELLEALVGLVYDFAGDQHDFDEISKAFCPIVAARIESARAIIAKCTPKQ